MDEWTNGRMDEWTNGDMRYATCDLLICRFADLLFAICNLDKEMEVCWLLF
jgi:hypothetical protein